MDSVLPARKGLLEGAAEFRDVFELFSGLENLLGADVPLRFFLAALLFFIDKRVNAPYDFFVAVHAIGERSDHQMEVIAHDTIGVHFDEIHSRKIADNLNQYLFFGISQQKLLADGSRHNVIVGDLALDFQSFRSWHSYS